MNSYIYVLATGALFGILNFVFFLKLKKLKLQLNFSVMETNHFFMLCIMKIRKALSNKLLWYRAQISSLENEAICLYLIWTQSIQYAIFSFLLFIKQFLSSFVIKNPIFLYINGELKTRNSSWWELIL